MAVNPIGMTFGRLTVESVYKEYRYGRSTRVCVCTCSCGLKYEATFEFLKTGKTNSCGCLRKEITSQNKKTHGESKTPLYFVWKTMRQRCLNPNDADYSDYGGRGITICSEWSDYSVFKNWAMSSGYQKGLTIERTNNDDAYRPNNCIWADRTVQANNRRPRRK